MKNPDTIKQLLRFGASVVICADDYRYFDLEAFARTAAANDAQLTLTIGDGLQKDELLSLARIARHNLSLVLK